MFILIGLLATTAIVGLTVRRALWQKALMVIPSVSAIVVLGLIGSAGTRGSAGWWSQPFWRDLLLYAIMLAGMMFRVAWDQLDKWRQQNAQPGARRRRRPRFDFWQFVYPVLPSIVVFQGVLLLAGKDEISVPLCLTSFQNGFFWHALLAKTRESIESKGAKA